jgi:predicted Zn-dependent peptidase
MSHAKSGTAVADQIRALAAEARDGWTGERIGYEMQKLGHPWNASTVSQFTIGRRQMLTVDEAVALLAIFKAKARMLENEIDKLVAELSPAGRSARTR